MHVRQAVILIGGLGTRLGSLTRLVPKPMLNVAGRPFLEYLMAYLTRYGIQEILLLAGFNGDLVREKYHSCKFMGASVIVSVEPEPLGTGGALAFAYGQLDKRFLLCNGDSLFDADLTPLLADIRNDVAVSLLLARQEDGRRFGSVKLDSSGRVIGFSEKGHSVDTTSDFINAGVYGVNREKISPFLSSGYISLEKEVFPKLVSHGMLRGVVGSGYFTDIGIPNSFNAAQTELPLRLARPAAFVDRDGVLNRDRGYTHKIIDLEWLPGAISGVRALNSAGYYVFVVTNQSGIARGFYSESDVQSFHSEMQQQLLKENAHIDAFYYCPHHPAGNVEGFSQVCLCRKPGTGLLEHAAKDWPVQLVDSFLIGDSDTDIDAANSFGIRGFRFDGYSQNLYEFVRSIIGQGERHR